MPHAGLQSGSGARSGRRLPWSTIEALGISRLVSDSRQVAAGDTFVAYPGETRDGRDFIPDAIERGVASVLWEPRNFAWKPQWKVRNAPVENLRGHAGAIASAAYGNPSSRLWVVGVT